MKYVGTEPLNEDTEIISEEVIRDDLNRIGNGMADIYEEALKEELEEASSDE